MEDDYRNPAELIVTLLNHDQNKALKVNMDGHDFPIKAVLEDNETVRLVI